MTLSKKSCLFKSRALHILAYEEEEVWHGKHADDFDFAEARSGLNIECAPFREMDEDMRGCAACLLRTISGCKPKYSSALGLNQICQHQIWVS